jgi:hypothetical protein
MHEMPPANETETSNDPSGEGVKPPEVASGWRAFFAVFLAGMCVSGNARPDPADFETRLHWQQMVTGISACSFGALVAAVCAVSWRKLPSYGSIVWRLYLVYVGAACLAGFMHGGNVAAYATGAALLAGLLTALSGVSLFYWRNAGTNLIYYFSFFAFVVGIVVLLLR